MTRIQFLMSGVFVVVFGFLGNIVSDEYAIYITIMALFCILFDEFFLTKYIEDKKLEAAIIQEDFDCDVLQLQRNMMKNDYKLPFELIIENNKKYILKNKNYDKLINWYPGMDVDNIDIKYGRIVCQKTNCWWD